MLWLETWLETMIDETDIKNIQPRSILIDLIEFNRF